MKMTRVGTACAFLVVAVSTVIEAQSQIWRPPSPDGASATEVLGHHDERAGYVGGKWLELRYGRPIKRGRDLFGPSDYAEILNDGAPVWRAGANVSTRLKTEVPIVLGNKTIAPGEYTLFIDLQPRRWTLIVSNWAAKTSFDAKSALELWGAYDYTPDRDVVRVPMTRSTLPYSFDQLAWEFLDMSDAGGKLALIWDKQIAWVPFRIQR